MYVIGYEFSWRNNCFDNRNHTVQQLAGMLPPLATRIARILGIVLAIIGVILMVLAAVGVAFGLDLPL